MLAQALGEYGGVSALADTIQQAAFRTEDYIRNLDGRTIAGIAVGVVVLVLLFRRR